MNSENSFLDKLLMDYTSFVAPSLLFTIFRALNGAGRNLSTDFWNNN